MGAVGGKWDGVRAEPRPACRMHCMVLQTATRAALPCVLQRALCSAATRAACRALRCVASEGSRAARSTPRTCTAGPAVGAAQSEPRSAALPVPLQPRNGRRASLALPVPLRASPAPRPRCRAAAKTTNRKRGDAARRPIGGGRGGARRSRAAVSRGRMRAGRGGRGRRAGSAGTPQSAPCGALLPAPPPAAPGRARSPSLAAPRKARPLPQCTVRSLSDSPAAPRAPNAALPHPAAPAAPPRSAPQSLQPTHIAACSPLNPPP